MENKKKNPRTMAELWQSLATAFRRIKARFVRQPKHFNPEDYPDFLDTIPLDAATIRHMIAEYPLEFSAERNDRVEWKMKLPMFVDAFYDYVVANARIPEQDTFFDHYLRANAAFFAERNFPPDLIRGIRARAYRAYPSLVRDVFFNKFAKEKLPKYTVIYNRTLDVEEGIDLMITRGTKHYAVSLYTDTLRAHAGRTKKQRRHTKFANVTYLDYPIKLRGTLRCGSFFLYGENEFKEMMLLIKEERAIARILNDDGTNPPPAKKKKKKKKKPVENSEIPAGVAESGEPENTSD